MIWMQQLQLQLLLLLLLMLLLLLLSSVSCQLTTYSKLCKSIYLTNRDYPTDQNATKLLTQLREAVSGCQYVHGDVVIQMLGTHPSTGRRLPGDIVNMTSDFLDSIVEVSGSVRLDQVGLRRLQMRNLRSIRGYNRPEGQPYSLQLENCKFLQQLSLPKLVYIGSGSVVLRTGISINLLCRLNATVNWTAMFQNPREQQVDDKLVFFYSGSASVERSTISCPKLGCSSECSGRDRRLCWTAASGDCQTDNRCRVRPCEFCYKNGGKEECCDSNCLGGCSSRNPSSCLSCRSVSLNGECVRQCPDGFEFDPASSKTVSVRPPMVRVGDVCFNSCPAPFVTDLQRRYCLGQCPASQMAISRNCTTCAAAGESCITCEIGVRTLKESGPINYTCNTLFIGVTTFNVDGATDSNATLMSLQPIRVIQIKGKFMVKRVQSLQFLHKLSYVTGDLYVMDSRLQYLGLANLKSDGRVGLANIEGLCQNWYPTKFLAKSAPYKLLTKDVQFSNDGPCAAATCDPLCASECWGPGPDLCVACRNFSVDGVCYATCQAAGRYELKGKCLECHEQCEGGCSGPGAGACVRCRHFTEEGVCVAACSRELSADSDGVCYSTSQLRLALALAGAGLLVLLLLILFLLGCWYHRRRMHRYEVVDLDECLSDPKNPSDMVQLLIVNSDDIVKQKEIGSGTFGTVFKGKLRTQTSRGVRNLPVAIKVLKGKNPLLGQELLSEANLMARVQHVRCIRLVALCMTEEVQLITALMPRGCLLDFLQSHAGKISAVRMLTWSQQVAEGMQYLESMGIVHRDLAARNVLLQSPDDVKITDFGLAKLLNVTEREFMHTSGLLPVKWLGIECIESGVFSHKSDVWSFGVLLWEICSYGESPYKPYRISSVEEITDILRKGIRLAQPQDCSVDFYNVMLSCWLPQPDSRPSFQDLVMTMKDCLLNPEKYIAAGRARLDEEDEYEDVVEDNRGEGVQLRSQQQQQQQQQQSTVDQQGYTPMSQVEQPDNANENVSLLHSKPNRYVSDPSDAARLRRMRKQQSASPPVQQRRKPAAAAADVADAGYLQPIAAANKPPPSRGDSSERAPLAESEYLQPRSLVTSDPVDVDDDYLAPRKC